MGVNTKSFDNASDMITFSRASGGYGLTKVSYGDELVTNGDFATDSDWTKGTGWSISGGQATHVAGTASNFSQAVSYGSAGTVYALSVDVVSISGGSGSIQARSGGTTTAKTISSLDIGKTVTLIYVHDGLNTDVAITTGAATNITIDNISVKEVTYNSSAADATLQLTYHPNNFPRIEYNTDGTAKGLLVEESRTNLITYSDAIDSSLTTLQNITPSDVEITSGVYQGTWRKFTEDTATSRHRLIGITAVTIPANSYATISCLVKNISGTRNVELMIYTGGDSFLGKFDLDAETSTVSKGGTGVSGTSAIENLGNGIYRISVSGIVSTTATVCSVILALADGVTVIYTGDGTSSIAATGMQVEAGAFPTSYIKTTGATATRSADVASIPVADFGYNQSEGTVTVEVDSLMTTLVANPMAYNFNNGTSQERLTVFGSSGAWRFVASDGGTDQASIFGGTFGEAKIASSFEQNKFNHCVNGTLSTEDTSGTMPTITKLDIGSQLGGNLLNGHIKSIKYYPRRLTDAQLQELTT